MADANEVRAVYDCVVFLQGAGRRHSPARRCLELADAGSVRLCLSPVVLTEIGDVLSRPALLQKFPLLTSEVSEALLRTLRAKALLFTDVSNVFTLPRDRDDEAYTDLAVAAGARYLVTWNERHLTYLMKQDTPEGRDFCQRFPDVRILSPTDFLREIEPIRGAKPTPPG
jgi:putative PIN family toxin of toxin-antitoxin system